MSDPQEVELTPFERSLASLTPKRGLVDRDRLMYEAGRRSVLANRRRSWIWPAVAASLGLVAVGQSIVLVRRPVERIVERVVVAPASQKSQPEPAEPVVILTRRPPEPRIEAAYPGLAKRSLREGVDEYPRPAMLAAVDLPPNLSDGIETLTPLHGRDDGQHAIPGGPL